jgi:dolichyl-phosphate-mannose-protein mannosyltransferase
MSIQARAARAPVRPRSRVAIFRASASAYGAVGMTAIFIALTCWWLSEDRSIPIFDAGFHLRTAIVFHDMLRNGDLLGPFYRVSQYPPLAPLIGALATFIGGVDVSSPIIGENLVFVSLLALGCYQTGRLLFGARAGLLAVIFVLGSPVLISQFHQVLLDAPEAAVVAVSMWLILASEDFSRARIAGLAGLAVGCGLLVKAQFPFFLAGIVLAALARGGWRNWRGLAAFAVIALVLAGPWYLDHLSELGKFSQLAGANSGAPPTSTPAALSSANLLWYFWTTLNTLLLAPLFLLVVGGSAWTIVGLVRREKAHEEKAQEERAQEETAREEKAQGLRLELLAGAFVAWLAISLTPHHDFRYAAPLMPYLAVIGSGWIVHLRRAPRLAMTALLVLAVAANIFGSTFGKGKDVELTLASSPADVQPFRDRIVFYSAEGKFVSITGPRRDGDLPGVLGALRANGVRSITWGPGETNEPGWANEGLIPLAMIAGLKPFPALTDPRHSVAALPISLTGDSAAAALVAAITPKAPQPCTLLSDGTGVWVLRSNPASGKVEHFCPFRQPRFYP